MSTDQPESSGTEKSDEAAAAEGYIPDSQLPEDLRPDENPLAASPEEEGEEGASPDGSGGDESSDS